MPPCPQVSQTPLEESMAEQEPTAEQLAQIAAENEEDEHSVNYKPPAQKSIQEIQELDKDDESLRKYKEALLGRVAVSADPNVPNVVVTRLTLVCSTAPGPLELDLTGDLESFKKQSFVLKEGVEYRIKISFRVNREIVSGMKYIQHTYRKGVKIDKTDYMVGSYGPRAEEYEFLTPMEEAPKGMLARGSYSIKSRFTDDDRTDHLSWESSRARLPRLLFFFFFGLFAFSRAAPAAYGGSQARSLIGAAATSLHHSHNQQRGIPASNVGSELRLQPTPQLTAMPDP
uniref:Rho GDP-dissociation inhibitor 1 n=2 Tax=Sus scrofa TaxID=9823 RepID=A0A8D0N9H5_PIG